MIFCKVEFQPEIIRYVIGFARGDGAVCGMVGVFSVDDLCKPYTGRHLEEPVLAAVWIITLTRSIALISVNNLLQIALDSGKLSATGAAFQGGRFPPQGR